jgi:DNA replication protein DnaC
MGYAREIQEQARQTLSDRRARARETASLRREELYSKVPELRETDQLLASTGIGAVRAVLAGAPEDIQKIKKQNLALQRRRQEILAGLDLTPDYLEPQYTCPACQDEGYVNGKRCRCYEQLLKEISYRRLNDISSLSLQASFDNFKLDYYSPVSDASGTSPRKRMEEIYRYCVRYAQSVTPGSKSLLLSGPTGLGKTHLSLSIAKTAIQNGLGVIYGSAPDLLSQVEKERFSRSETGEDSLALMLSCDLLILDDLGAEFSTSFTVSCIYNIINTRINRGLPTIISTNGSLSDLLKGYQDRVVSRIMGSYEVLRFCGNDIRQQMAMQR